MSFWSQVIGTIHITFRNNDNEITSPSKAFEIIKAYFGETFTFYSSNISELNENCKLPKGSEGSIKYTISDITDYSEHEKRSKWKHFKRDFDLMVSFKGDLRDSNLLVDNSFENWFNSIPVVISLDDEQVMVTEKLFHVRDDLAGEGKTFYWTL